MNNEKAILYGVIGFLLGVVLSIVFAANAVNNHMTGAMNMMGMNATATKELTEKTHMMKNGKMMRDDMMNDENSMSMEDMVDTLKGKTGDKFDREFIKQMIPHHQGAIDMAKEAQKNAGHDEIKNLADEIIAAQTKEINQMKEWQQTWGY